MNSYINYLLYSNDLEKAKDKYKKYKSVLSDIEKLNIEKDFYDAEKNYEGAYEKLQDIQKLTTHNKDKYLSNLSYFLLKQNKFQEAKDLLTEYLQKRNFSRTLESELINYELARSKIGQKVDKVRLGDLNSNTKSDLVKAAICALENQNDDAFQYIDKALEKNASLKYDFKDWPVFNTLKENQRYKKYFQPIA